MDGWPPQPSPEAIASVMAFIEMQRQGGLLGAKPTAAAGPQALPPAVNLSMLSSLPATAASLGASPTATRVVGGNALTPRVPEPPLAGPRPAPSAFTAERLSPAAQYGAAVGGSPGGDSVSGLSLGSQQHDAVEIGDSDDESTPSREATAERLAAGPAKPKKSIRKAAAGQSTAALKPKKIGAPKKRATVEGPESSAAAAEEAPKSTPHWSIPETIAAWLAGNAASGDKQTNTIPNLEALACEAYAFHCNVLRDTDQWPMESKKSRSVEESVALRTFCTPSVWRRREKVRKTCINDILPLFVKEAPSGPQKLKSGQKLKDIAEAVRQAYWLLTTSPSTKAKGPPPTTVPADWTNPFFEVWLKYGPCGENSPHLQEQATDAGSDDENSGRDAQREASFKRQKLQQIGHTPAIVPSAAKAIEDIMATAITQPLMELTSLLRGQVIDKRTRELNTCTNMLRSVTNQTLRDKIEAKMLELWDEEATS